MRCTLNTESPIAFDGENEFKDSPVVVGQTGRDA
jgi:hypothetical protein